MHIFPGALLGTAALLFLGLDVAALHDWLVAYRGTSFDYYLIWAGTREFWGGANPYSLETALKIQQGLLGHIAVQTENQYYFVYPAFAVFVFAPLAWLSFEWSVTVWLLLQQVFIVAALLLLLRALGWRPSFLGVLALISAWVLFRYTWMVIILAQTSALLLFLLAAAAWATSRGKSEWAAVSFALAMIKPQLTILPLLGWVVMMLVAKRFRPLAVFALAMIGIAALPVFRLGNWIAEMWQIVGMYSGYNRLDSPLTLLVGNLAPNMQSLSVALGAAIGAFFIIRFSQREKNPAIVFSLCILITLAVVPVPSVYDLVLILFPWLVLLHQLVGSTEMPKRFLLLALAAVPALSWAIIILVPLLFDHWRYQFDAVTVDKALIPLFLLGIFCIIQAGQVAPADHKAIYPI